MSTKSFVDYLRCLTQNETKEKKRMWKEKEKIENESTSKKLYVFPLEIICFSWHLPPTPLSDYMPKPNEDTNKDKNYIT